MAHCSIQFLISSRENSTTAQLLIVEAEPTVRPLGVLGQHGRNRTRLITSILEIQGP
jgi:hypothetical protein